MSKIFVWSNSDLDGVGSVIMLGAIFSDIEYEGVFFGDFEARYQEWIAENYSKYDKIFIVGIPLEQTLVNKLDDKKVIFISDKNDKVTVYDSTLVKEDYSSCTKLIYKKFKDKIQFPTELKQLALYIDDYNSYKLSTREAEYINAIYRKSGSKRFNFFVNRYWNGFDGFTERELNKANQFFFEIENEVKGLDIYEGEYKGFRVVATFSKLSVNEIAAEVLKLHSPDVVIVVNLDTQFVSFRKNIESKADIKFMAENLCSGGGGEFASGGKLTPKFLEFTQTLNELQ